MFKTLLVCLVLLVIGGAGFGAYKLIPLYEDYKSQIEGVVENSTPDTFRLQEASYIYDSNGNVLAKLTGDEDSSYLTYDQIPQNAVNAFVAIEDRTFWENPGIDIKGIFRVAVNYFLTEGAEKHGASTDHPAVSEKPFSDPRGVDGAEDQGDADFLRFDEEIHQRADYGVLYQ